MDIEAKVEEGTKSAMETLEEQIQNMRDINLGEKYIAIVTGISDGEINVDIGKVYTGIVSVREFEERHRPLPQIGDQIKVFVTRIKEEEGIVFFSINPPQYVDWSRWKSWNAKINEHSAVVAMRFLQELCDSYNIALTKAKEKYEDDKKKIRDRNHSKLSTIKNQHSTTVSNLKNANQRALTELDNQKKQSYEAYNTDLETYLTHSKKNGFIRKLIEKMIASQVESLDGEAGVSLQQAAEIRDRLAQAFDAQKQQLAALLEANVKQAQAQAELDESKEAVRYNQENDDRLNAFKQETEAMYSRFKEAINDVLSISDVGQYINSVLSTIPSFTEYSCSPLVPEYICLGDVSMEIATKSKILPEVAQLITTEASKALDTSIPGAITARLPYCQRLDKGISMFLNYPVSERIRYHEQLKMILLKLFMAFPAGKLEATMIDPLEFGKTFSMFTELGSEEARIIDKKIWSDAQEISAAIKNLRKKMETVAQTYGEDYATRLKKEPVRVLAITDFPNGFTQNAIEDLRGIVRNSASSGVCVFIWANAEEVAKLQSSQQAIFNEIREMLNVAVPTGNGGLILETAKFKNVKLHLDPLDKARDYIRPILSTIGGGIHNAQKKIERFEDMYEDIEDPNNWFGGTTIEELSLPIGIKGASTVVKMVMGKAFGTEHHALVAGQTGAGKSTLLHTIIMSTLLNYSPDEAQLYLIDFKEGVEFKTYSKLNLPSIRLIAIDCEREFGLNILKNLSREMKRRFDLYEREAGCKDIISYRRATGKKIPKLLLIIDEVQDLFRIGLDDEIGKECTVLMSELLEKGRAAGIHIILASQSFNQVSIKSSLYPHAAIRIAIKGSTESANSVLGEGNNGAEQLDSADSGAAVYNGGSGKSSANNVFQVAYLDRAKRSKLLSMISSYQNNEVYAKKYKEKTRILLTNAEDDISNIFNQLILENKVQTLDEDETRYCLAIGEGFDLNRKFKIGIAPKQRQNLLMIGRDEKKAASLFYFSMLSLLYGELGNADVRKDNQLIHLIDLSVEEDYMEPDNTNFKHIAKLFEKQVTRVRMDGIDALISNVYDSMTRRMDGVEDSEERLFLMVFGLNRAYKLAQANMYEEDGDSEKMTTLAKLLEIIKHGAKYGINCILWGENLNSTSKLLGASIERDFAQRIVFSSDSATMEQIVMEQDASTLRDTTAVYMNVDDDIKNTHFRPYEIPAKVWVKRIAEAYHKFE